MMVSDEELRMSRRVQLQIWRGDERIRAFMASLYHVYSPEGKLCFAPNDELIAHASYERTFHVWDIESGRELLRGPAGSGYRILMSPNGTLLAAARDGRSTTVWDIRAKQETLRLKKRPNEVVNQMAWSANSQLLAESYHSPPLIRVWDLEKRERRCELQGQPGAISCLAFSGGGNLLASASSDTTVLLWSV
jgi:U4/U6 small nuclear ribonucleoprotein PRP4